MKVNEPNDNLWNGPSFVMLVGPMILPPVTAFILMTPRADRKGPVVL